jgi:hypothetical protein
VPTADALDRRSRWKRDGNDRMQSGGKPQAAETTENGLIKPIAQLDEVR